MRTIQQHKINATLNKLIRYDEGVMSRKDWLNLMRVKGATVYSFERRNEAAEEKLQERIDWLKRNAPTGNECHPETKHLRAEQQRLKEGIFITEYRLQRKDVKYLTDITKTEYDYFNNLQLSEDIRSSKEVVNDRIEAEIATDEEIENDMQEDFNFFKKYA